ncbi:hypothetical protein WCE14_09260 [Acinetobacter schindleri]|uniref:hypothetical protein n=1 Tax=Acinetobacter schindleri TaxID=108981 RepID=UPI0034D493B4
MKVNNNILKIELFKKWVGARKGRMSLLATLLGKNKKALYAIIHENRMSPDLMRAVEAQKLVIQELEQECIKQFPYFVRFVRKGEGRMSRLAEKLEVSTNAIRGLAHAKKDGRFLLINYGVKRVVNAIRDIEQERRNASYSHEKMDVKAYISEQVRRRNYSLSEVMQLADQIKQHADAGNQDAAVICRVMGEGKYRILSVGFDTHFSDMCKSHVCDQSNPHIHASLFAALSLPKKERDQVGYLMQFSHSAPCPGCAKRLINLGIAEVYCYFEPELLDGVQEMGDLGIPVYKYNVVHKTVKTINSVTRRVA